MTSPFSPATLTAIAKLQAFEKTAAFQRVGAYVIIAPAKFDVVKDIPALGIEGYAALKPLQYGKVKVAFPADGAGKLQLWVWDCAGTDIQYATASGYGYDKLSAAMACTSFDGVEFMDSGESWESQLHSRGYTVIQAF